MHSILRINVEDLLHLRGVESARVEFKESWNDGPVASAVLRTVCAFANDWQNLNGGYLVLGVGAQDGKAELPPQGLSPERLEEIQKKIRGRCNTLDPPYQPVLSPETVQGRHLLVIWAPASEVRPHQAPESAEKGSPRKFFVRIGAETVEAKGETLTQLMQLTARVPFDDRRATDVLLERLREPEVREYLTDIRSNLQEEPDARVIYRNMFISSRVNGHEVPRNVGLLFFSEDPGEWFRGARVEVVQFADDASGNVMEERIFRGPLHRQIRSCLSYLRSFSVQHLEKLQDQPEVKGWVSYPLPAMEESLVNALYHRSYEPADPEPTKVYLYPDRMEVISYPGPVPGLELEHFRPGSKIPPHPARNRRIGELLKELGLAEGRGTGVPKVYREMARNGSPEPRFDFDTARSYFRVTLPAHPEYVAISALRDAAHLRAIGDLAGARGRLRAALQEQPASTVIATALIEDFSRGGDLSAAREVFLAFPAESSGFPGVVLSMAGAYLNEGLVQEAKSLLDRLPSLLAPQESFSAAILERRAGRHDRAHRYFERAGEAVLRDVRALHEFAQAKVRLAQEIPRFPQSRYNRDARTRLLREARDLLKRVLQMDAPPTRHAWAWFDLGRVLRWLKAPSSEVKAAFENALRLAPDEERFRRELEKT